METRSGKGIFLIVISIITLIVAIVGATFAYFTAQLQGDRQVEVTAYKFASTMSINEVVPRTGDDYNSLQPTADFIPLNDSDVISAVNTTNNCVDERGYRICKVYEVKISNSGDAMKFTGKLEVQQSGFKNLKFRLLSGSVDNLTEVTGSDATAIPEFPSTTPATLPSAAITFENGATELEVSAGTSELPTDATYYLVIWLSNNEEGVNETTNPQDAEQGAKFTGNIVFDSATGGAKLVGQIRS